MVFVMHGGGGGGGGGKFGIRSGGGESSASGWVGYRAGVRLDLPTAMSFILRINATSADRTRKHDYTPSQKHMITWLKLTALIGLMGKLHLPFSLPMLVFGSHYPAVHKNCARG